MIKQTDNKIILDDLQSKTISFLRFPLIVAVVFIHSTFFDIQIGGNQIVDTTQYSIFYNISNLFSHIIAGIAVPLFFMISGFLFFYTTKEFSLNTYFNKLKKRSKSILIPYVFWNLIVLLLFFLVQTIFSGLLSGNSKLIKDYSFTDYLWAFWDTSQINIDTIGKFPINTPLWYIRDLIVVMLFSPIIYFLIKRLKEFVVFALGVFWILDYWFKVPGFSIMAFFFFTFGAYFGINKLNFVERIKPFKDSSLIIYILLVLLELIFKDKNWITYIHNLGIIVGIVLLVNITSHFISNGKWKVNYNLTNSSFFIFAYHAMPLLFLIKITFKFLQPSSNIMLLILYFILPTIIILFGLLLYNILKKFLPKFTSFITGSRL